MPASCSHGRWHGRNNNRQKSASFRRVLHSNVGRHLRRGQLGEHQHQDLDRTTRRQDIKIPRATRKGQVHANMTAHIRYPLLIAERQTFITVPCAKNNKIVKQQFLIQMQIQMYTTK